MEITRLNNQLVSLEKTIETTGYKSMDAFEKYNQEQKSTSEKVTHKILSRKLKDGPPILYLDAYKEEFEKLEAKVLVSY